MGELGLLIGQGGSEHMVFDGDKGVSHADLGNKSQTEGRSNAKSLR